MRVLSEAGTYCMSTKSISGVSSVLNILYFRPTHQTKSTGTDNINKMLNEAQYNCLLNQVRKINDCGITGEHGHVIYAT
jgi:hypothetical protein